MILTEIDEYCNKADAYFPTFNKDEWIEEEISKKEYKDIKYRHVLYKRKK